MGRLSPPSLYELSGYLGDAVLNAIIVDDEAPARSELRYLLGEVGGVRSARRSRKRARGY